MKKSKILISAVTMFSLCITPMSVYAQVDPNSNIENTISQTKSAENLPTPVLQEKEIEVSNGTGYSLNNIQGAETVKALEQGTIVISYKATLQRWEHEAVLEAVHEKTWSRNETYKQRRCIVEHPFGTVKRSLGYSFFLRKRIENVDAEASSMFIAYNLKRLFAVFSTQELIAKFR